MRFAALTALVQQLPHSHCPHYAPFCVHWHKYSVGEEHYGRYEGGMRVYWLLYRRGRCVAVVNWSSGKVWTNASEERSVA